MTTAEFQLNVLPLKNKLYAFACRLLTNAEEARDTVQEVMLKMWESGKPLADYENIEAWCMTMVRNRSLDKIRVGNIRQQHLKVIHRGKRFEKPHSEKMELQEMVQHVIRFMNTLPVVQRELVELRDFQEKSYEELVEITGLEMSQVKVYLHRARKTIREKITELNAYGLQHN
ncbi:MAG: RNA polymerase sigma factor [Flavobacteriales bacterium]|nr:RNA polymerase sigma factor [Flavobacteriales bacterium]